MKDVIKVSVVNFKTKWGNKEANLSRIEEYIIHAANEKTNLIVFPEMCLTGYDDEVDKIKEEKMQTILAETIPGPSTVRISNLAKENNIIVCFGMPEKDKNNSDIIYNSAAIVHEDGRIEGYRKMHLPNPEPNWAIRGDEPMVFDSPWGKIGLSICYDTYKFPELIRYARAKGARLYVNCTACCKETVLPKKVQLQLENYASTNSIFIASANLCGKDKYNYFRGGSSIVGPTMDNLDVVYYAGRGFFDEGSDIQGIFTAIIDLSQVDDNNLFVRNEKLGTPDFRPEIYARMYSELMRDKRWLSFYDNK